MSSIPTEGCASRDLVNKRAIDSRQPHLSDCPRSFRRGIVHSSPPSGADHHVLVETRTTTPIVLQANNAATQPAPDRSGRGSGASTGPVLVIRACRFHQSRDEPVPGGIRAGHFPLLGETGDGLVDEPFVVGGGRKIGRARVKRSPFLTQRVEGRGQHRRGVCRRPAQKALSTRRAWSRSTSALLCPSSKRDSRSRRNRLTTNQKSSRTNC